MLVQQFGIRSGNQGFGRSRSSVLLGIVREFRDRNRRPHRFQSKSRRLVSPNWMTLSTRKKKMDANVCHQQNHSSGHQQLPSARPDDLRDLGPDLLHELEWRCPGHVELPLESGGLNRVADGGIQVAVSGRDPGFAGFQPEPIAECLARRRIRRHGVAFMEMEFHGLMLPAELVAKGCLPTVRALHPDESSRLADIYETVMNIVAGLLPWSTVPGEFRELLEPTKTNAAGSRFRSVVSMTLVELMRRS